MAGHCQATLTMTLAVILTWIMSCLHTFVVNAMLKGAHQGCEKGAHTNAIDGPENVSFLQGAADAETSGADAPQEAAHSCHTDSVVVVTCTQLLFQREYSVHVLACYLAYGCMHAKEPQLYAADQQGFPFAYVITMLASCDLISDHRMHNGLPSRVYACALLTGQSTKRR